MVTQELRNAPMSEHPEEANPPLADTRLVALHQWLREELALPVVDVTPASADASFRRYFRVSCADGCSRIVMDAPPDKEEVRPFVAISALLAGLGLHVPRVLAQDERQGFLLLTDLGSQQYLGMLADAPARLYGDALRALVRLQSCPAAEMRGLPLYDEMLLREELALFSDWYLQRLLGVSLEGEQRQVWEESGTLLVSSALEQPQVLVHRDYHSRNLMVTQPNPGILDFQDAVVGPVSYDVVSLLRDCYIAWPREQVEGWLRDYHRLACDAGVLRDVPFRQLLRWFDLMGVQRHLKAAGIFARLRIRDGKPGYLQDIPRTLGYVREVCSRYRELAGLGRLLAALPPLP